MNSCTLSLAIIIHLFSGFLIMVLLGIIFAIIRASAALCCTKAPPDFAGVRDRRNTRLSNCGNNQENKIKIIKP